MNNIQINNSQNISTIGSNTFLGIISPLVTIYNASGFDELSLDLQTALNAITSATYKYFPYPYSSSSVPAQSNNIDLSTFVTKKSRQRTIKKIKKYIDKL